MPSEFAAGADLTRLRYAQCWEDADVLLAALDVQPGDTCLSIASAGDNTLALLTRDPARVIAVDLNPSQLACLALKVAAFRALDHGALLELVGSRPSRRRGELYRRCRGLLSADAQQFWDRHAGAIGRGIGAVGTFERYLALFRSLVLPLVHGRARVERLLRGGTAEARVAFYDRLWDGWRWRLLFRLFCSRRVMARLGRDPSCFRHVEGGVGSCLLERARFAATAQNPSDNPYLRWILTGVHDAVLPLYLRGENFATIRDRLDRLEWYCASLEDVADGLDRRSIDRFNLSNIFEYMSEDGAGHLLRRLSELGRPGGRLAYWNLFVARHRPDDLAARLRPAEAVARALHAQDKAFFYGDFVVEEVV